LFSLNHHITKEKKKKKNIPIRFLQTPHPTPPKKQLLEKLRKSHLPTLKFNQTSPSHASQETTIWVNPHPPKNPPIPIP
jgi:hypothetical protein